MDASLSKTPTHHKSGGLRSLRPSGAQDLSVLGDDGVLSVPGAGLVRSPKYEQLHEKKPAQCCTGDCAKLGNQDVRGKCRKTIAMKGKNRRDAHAETMDRTGAAERISGASR
jgi:hypothetical protein